MPKNRQKGAIKDENIFNNFRRGVVVSIPKGDGIGVGVGVGGVGGVGERGRVGVCRGYLFLDLILFNFAY